MSCSICLLPSTLGCPTCIELGLEPTLFCSQECFAANWNVHKKIHKKIKASQQSQTTKKQKIELTCEVIQQDVIMESESPTKTESTLAETPETTSSPDSKKLKNQIVQESESQQITTNVNLVQDSKDNATSVQSTQIIEYTPPPYPYSLQTSKDPRLKLFRKFNFSGSLRPFPMKLASNRYHSLQDAKKYNTKFNSPELLPDWALHPNGESRAERFANKTPGLIPKILDSEEIEALKASCLLGRRALDLAASLIKPGVSGEEVDRQVHEFLVSNHGLCGSSVGDEKLKMAMVLKGNLKEAESNLNDPSTTSKSDTNPGLPSYPSPLNYFNFPRSCCISINETICHGIPDSRPFVVGDLVNVDISCYFRGFHADLNETFVVVPEMKMGENKSDSGSDNDVNVSNTVTSNDDVEMESIDRSSNLQIQTADAVTTSSSSDQRHRLKELQFLRSHILHHIHPDTLRLIRGTYESLIESIKICKPGIMYRSIGDVIEKVAKKYKLSVVRSYCGHGVGKLFHCPPNIPHYGRNKTIGVMKEGHVFTIEPMLNLGSHKDMLWPDDWTVTSVDGKWSAQFEHTIRITKEGCEILTGRGIDRNGELRIMSPLFGWDVATGECVDDLDGIL